MGACRAYEYTACVAADRLPGSIVLSIAALLTHQAFQVALDLVRKKKSADVDQALGPLGAAVCAKHLLRQTHLKDDRSSLINYHKLGILLPHG